MSFALIHKIVTYLAAGLGLVALVLGRQVDAPFAVMFALGFVGSVFVEQPIVSDRRWTGAWTVAVVGFFGVQVARGVLGGSLLTLAVEYAAFLQISRLFNRNTARDHQQIAVLAFLHLVAASVFSTGLSYAFTFIGFVVVTPWMLALTHLRSEIERNYAGANADERNAADVRRVLASRRVVSPSYLGYSTLLSVPLFATTAALFLLFPRVGMGFLTFGAGETQRVAGFGHNVELGGFGTIRDDPTVVLRVTVPQSVRARDGTPQFRMRGTSFDRYDGRRWTRTPAGVGHLRRSFETYFLSNWRYEGRNWRSLRYDIVLDPLDEPVVFLPEGTHALSVPPRVRGGLAVSRRLVRSMGFDIRYLDGDGLPLVYSAYVVPGERPTPTEEALSLHDRSRYLQMPEGHDALRGLVQRVVGGARSDAQKAARVLAYLRDSGRFHYTLEQPNTHGGLPLLVFLTEARRGHCEYFSTAMALMLRATGVPARNVTGFLGGRYNPYGGYYAIRQGDAHSWVEAYVDGAWRTFDPTPAARNAIQPDEGAFGGLHRLIDALATKWATHVVGYDLGTQATYARRIWHWLSFLRSDSPVARGLPPVSAETKKPSQPAWWVWAVAFAVALGAVGLALFFRRKTRDRASRRAEQPWSQATLLYRELERALARRGRPRPLSITPNEHAKQLGDDGFDGAAEVEEVTRTYMALRFAGDAPIDADLSRLRTLIRDIETRASTAGVTRADAHGR